ncbi:DNA-directed RNA polymerase I subunit RPA49 [Schistosoma japonicum]|uniref:DNA-directed RNA polymerase I subunit RPA49 n=2 Tax=Schistosoma japonicum TaxID=6182 RepID=A0A4Z2DJP2_SCHJA|nr:DNA-directed RNA polymerase I subunit RPA49 [Schistosoma japonicum]KAH8877388.1 DNA-directed RNA polymerase I subunit RPA49 [Schistosoma japonicum]KAH8877390.1 DNA-directed RNA polymerase I subunit RPA49 [Schistosoma japonicum]TNN16680.1 DNA-directed RNA polymerase I subunit RPA49 [Schistosoma japonicum]TNN16681.1 DNA-directed RNA polymerase I subunit RPA49 [Schistosoma japonicum]
MESMNFFPAPFSLGTSDMMVTDVLPAHVDVCLQNIEKSTVSCQVGNVVYSSKLKSPLRDSNYATIIYNKRTKTVEVIHKKPEFLEPCFDDDVIEVPNALKADRATLINAFGSVKKQRAMREIERNKTHKDSVTNAQVIDRAMHGQTKLKTDNEANSNNPDNEIGCSNSQIDERFRLLPPIDLKASRPEDVYPYNKLVPPKIVEALNSEVQHLLSLDASSVDTLLTKSIYPQWVMDKLCCLCSNKSADYSKHVTSLVLLSHMLALFHLPKRDLMRKVPLPDTPNNVSKHLLTQFTASISRQGMGRLQVRAMSPMLRDKLITHILVLILHCDNFKTIIDNLTVDLKIGRDRLAQFFQYLGCRCTKVENAQKKSESNIIAELVTPVKLLDFKPSRRPH